MDSLKQLVKFALGTDNIVVEDHEEYIDDKGEPCIDLKVRPYKKDTHICPKCGRHAPGYDTSTEERRWRAVDWGGVKVYIICETVRISCPEHGVITASVPWAFSDSKFTKSFDMLVSYLAINTSKSKVAEIFRIDWHTIARCVRRAHEHLEQDLSKRLENLRRIGIDETSYAVGHSYITTVVNLDLNELVYAAPGHDEKTLAKFFEQLSESQRNSIEYIAGDGASWIDGCANKYCPNATRCLDGFHVIEWVQKALSDVRKGVWNQERDKLNKLKKKALIEEGKFGVVSDKTKEDIKSATKAVNAVKSSKYALGKNPENLTEKQEEKLKQVNTTHNTIAKAYLLKELARQIFKLQGTREEAKEYLDSLITLFTNSGLIPFQELGQKLKRHTEHILNTVTCHLSSAAVEASNNTVKLFIRRAYGYKNLDNLISLLMLRISHIQIPLPGRNIFATT